jgi:hypothetical protein
MSGSSNTTTTFWHKLTSCLSCFPCIKRRPLLNLKPYEYNLDEFGAGALYPAAEESRLEQVASSSHTSFSGKRLGLSEELLAKLCTSEGQLELPAQVSTNAVLPINVLIAEQDRVVIGKHLEIEPVQL